MKKSDIIKMLEPFDNDDEIAFDGNPFLWQPEKICGERDVIMGYVCSLNPGHKGECWCRHKDIEFTPDYNTYGAENDS